MFRESGDLGKFLNISEIQQLRTSPQPWDRYQQMIFSYFFNYFYIHLKKMMQKFIPGK